MLVAAAAVAEGFEMLGDVKKGASTGGGDMPPDKRQRAEQLIGEFESKLVEIVTAHNIRRRFVRPMPQGSVFCGSYSDKYFVAYHPHLGMPSIVFMALTGTGDPTSLAFNNFLADSTGQDFAVIELRDSWLNLGAQQRSAIMTATVNQFIQAELARTKVDNTMIPFNPLFGQNIYPIQHDLVFVLMPFSNDLTAIYNSIVKPAVEEKGLVSRRADDIASNNAIMQDIWRNICQARFIIADITGRNPNVMYELGIAHTIGKEVILIHQANHEESFPFDISHMRIVNYENTATGGGKLKTAVSSTIDSVLEKLATYGAIH